jgi:hypothetical protein
MGLGDSHENRSPARESFGIRVSLLLPFRIRFTRGDKTAYATRDH